MKPLLFCGGGYPPEAFIGTTRKRVVPNRLFTYAYDRKWSDDMQAFADEGCVLMLDSGAFTFYMQAKKGGSAADRRAQNEKLRESHTRLIEQVGSRFHICAALDVLYDAELTWENYEWQRQRVGVFPTWHVDSGFEALKQIIGSGADRFGIGGMAQTAKGKPRGYNLQVLHEVFDMITDAAGVPTIKTHGFAMGSGVTVYSFPWTTVDAATAMRAADMGKVLWFHDKDRGGFRCGDVSQLQLRTSEAHADSETAGDRTAVLLNERELSTEEMDTLHERLGAAGYLLDDVREHYAYRLAFNTMELMRGEALIPLTYTRPTAGGLGL